MTRLVLDLRPLHGMLMQFRTLGQQRMNRKSSGEMPELVWFRFRKWEATLS